nr:MULTISPECIES: site-specific integrase [Corynebacterium]
MPPRKRTRRAFGKITSRRGRFVAEYTGPDSKVHRPGRSFSTKMDAEGWLYAERRLIELETWTPPKQRRAKEAVESVTVGQWLDRFHESLEQRPKPVRRSTMQTYRRCVANRITAPEVRDADLLALRDIPLAELSKRDVYRWWDAVQRCFPDTAPFNQKAYGRLRAACLEAVRRELIVKNPVEVPEASQRVKAKEKYLPEDWEIQALIDAVSEPYQALTALMLHHGLRIGEAIALEREDVVVEATAVPYMPKVLVTVKQNAQRLEVDGKTRMVVQPPKTKAGYRQVPILPGDVPLFLRHLARYSPTAPTTLYEGDGTRQARLFTATSAGAMMLDTSYRSVLGRAKKRAGVNAGINPHTGRNWLITRLAEQGAHVKEIGALLGQDDMNTIMGVYMKVRAGRTHTMMERVGKSIQSSPSKVQQK